MLCFLMWMKKEDGYDIHPESIQLYQFAIRELLHDFKSVIERNTGNGLKIKKFHQLLHLPFLLTLYGAFSNSDTGPCERLLKYVVKNPFRSTQKRPKSAHLQIARRIIDNLVMDKAFKLYECDQLVQAEALDNQQYLPQQTKLCGTKYVLSRHHKEGLTIKIGNVEISGSSNVPKWNVLSFISESILRYLPDNTPLHLYTEHKRHDVLFRCHPCYRNESEWYDWAIFEFGIYQRAAQILSFIDLQSFEEEELAKIKYSVQDRVYIGDPLNQDIPKRGIYAVVNELQRPSNQNGFVASYNDSEVPDIIGHSVRMHSKVTNDWKLSIIDVESIYEVCIVIDDDTEKKPFDVIEVRPPTEWSRLFVSIEHDDNENTDDDSHSKNESQTEVIGDDCQLHDTRTTNNCVHYNNDSDGYFI